MLARVEVVVAATEGVELVVVAALDDEALFDNKDLVGAADGGKAVRDDEGGAALHELLQAGLDHGFGFGVERACGFIEDEDARLGEQGAGNRQALTLAARKLDAAFANDGVVTIREAFGELVDARGVAGVRGIVLRWPRGAKT